MNSVSLLLESLADSNKLAQFCLLVLPSPIIISLFGDLGSGKTQFVKFFAQHLQIKANVPSPSFVKMNIYHFGKGKSLVHLDGYHLSATSDLKFFSDYFDRDYVFIEWPEIFSPFLTNFLQVKLFWSFYQQEKRIVKITGPPALVGKIKNLWEKKRKVYC